MLQNIQV